MLLSDLGPIPRSWLATYAQLCPTNPLCASLLTLQNLDKELGDVHHALGRQLQVWCCQYGRNQNLCITASLAYHIILSPSWQLQSPGMHSSTPSSICVLQLSKVAPPAVFYLCFN